MAPSTVQSELTRDFSGGLVSSARSWQLSPSQSPYMRNMEVNKKGSVASSYGYVTLDSPVGSSILGLFTLYLNKKNRRHMVRMYENKVEQTLDPLALVPTWTSVETLAPFSIRTASYSWSASASGTGEYYLRTLASGDPGFSEPSDVRENGAELVFGTLGFLSASQWGYGDNDGLGYNTIYVRLSDSADPDGKAADFVTVDYNPAGTFGGVQYADALWYCDGNYPFRSWDGSSVTAYASAPRGNVLVSWRSQCFMAGVKNNRSTLYYSDIDNFTNWTSGSAGSITVNRQDGEDIVGLFPLGDVLIVFKERSIYKVAYEFDQQTSTSFYSVTPIPSSYGAVATRSVARIKNDVMALSNFGIISVGQQENYVGLRTGSISDNIRDDLRTTLYGGAINKDTADLSCSIFFEDKFFLSVPILEAVNPSSTYLYDSLYNSWTYKEGVGASQFVIYRNSKLEDYLFFSSSDGSINYFDTVHSYGEAPFPKEYHTRRNQLGEPGKKSIVHAVIITGAKSLDSTIECTYVRDYETEEFQITDDHLIQNSSGGYVGENYHGDNYFGGDGSADPIRQYRYRRIFFPNERQLYEVQLQLLNEMADEPYSIDSIQIIYSPLDLQEASIN